MAVDTEFAESLTVGALLAHPRKQRVRLAGNPTNEVLRPTPLRDVVNTNVRRMWSQAML